MRRSESCDRASPGQRLWHALRAVAAVASGLFLAVGVGLLALQGGAGVLLVLPRR